MLTTLLLPALSLAALLTPTGPIHSFEEVNLHAGAKLMTPARTANLSAVGQGLRYKKVVFVKARVYVGQLLVSEPEKLNREKEKVLDSLASMKSVAMQMTFLRDVDAKTVEGAFKDSFEENDIDLNQEAIKQFLAAVKNGGEAKEGKTLTVASEIVDGKEYIYYEGTNGQISTVEGSAGLRRQIFSLWLGKPTDGGVENLQEGLLKK